ncbi:hypothetical protein UFOVP105_38 [uncultured Caudovirales phage]|uniref:Uncharacterized protein n=1 Tax=uncultured Caudovirales phage TaxID=2100421 RepID=A0A6J5L129_9CAUD|nr:hypothetical protein UFOVP105_38 [uncultured Caudovirales phage]
MEKLILKVAISYDDLRKMAVRIHGEIWDDKKIFEYFGKRKTLEVQESEISRIEDSAFEVFTALSLALIEMRNKEKKINL